MRATIHPWPAEVAQLMGSFSPDLSKLKKLTFEILDKLGKPLAPPRGPKKIAAFKTSVASAPRVGDCVIGSGNLLVRDGYKFNEYQRIEPQIRAIEMEAAGIIQALNDGDRSGLGLLFAVFPTLVMLTRTRSRTPKPMPLLPRRLSCACLWRNGFDRLTLVGASPDTPR